MYAITGITGQVGGALANALLEAGQRVRAVVRDARKGDAWRARGCEVAVATMTDADALAQAFEGAHGVFILLPPEFDPAPGFPEAREVIDAIVAAVSRAKPRRIVCLSTIGAQAAQENLLTQHTLLQEALASQPIPVAFLRPGWFMENSAWDVQSAREEGIVHSFLQPLDRAIPMIATGDIGKAAAKLLQEAWQGHRIIELEGPKRVSPDDIARAFATALGKPVRAQPVPRDTWQALFEQQGMRHPMPRIRMLDGFNEGWIDFEKPRDEIIKGDESLESVIRKLVA
ncbi:NmrA family NAD(P)-binding protein [Caballeronia sp. LZ025]|uniref:NmrA family NAD(P)-binding protein n=1 Tax=Caballeronia TaxID=1827195 RepID=UPI001FD60620|nr:MULTISPECIES: NmrA family NAD(P)-binding protein [Caballeronia]MDR5734500.1 NmrA family NAD(P)-binding protein [Caballeronia sp. LZ025]